jgi:hypothetical protein
MRGPEMPPESRSVASVQSHDVNTGEPAAPDDLHGYPKSPVRENRTPGSVQEPVGQPPVYCDYGRKNGRCDSKERNRNPFLRDGVFTVWSKRREISFNVIRVSNA